MAFSIIQDGEHIDTGYGSATKEEALKAIFRLHLETLEDPDDIEYLEALLATGTEQQMEVYGSYHGFKAVPIKEDN